MKISEFFKDSEHCFSQKRLQVFLAFVVAVILVFMCFDIEYIAVFLTYGSLNTLVSTTESRHHKIARTKKIC